MQQSHPFHIQVLKDEFERRQRVNPLYSLRSFARFLKMDSGALSAVLREKRNLPNKTGHSLSQILGLQGQEKNLFLKSLESNRKSSVNHPHIKNPLNDWKLPEYKIIEENTQTYKILSQWEYFAFLSLLDTPSFKNNEKWIAQRLGLKTVKVKEIIEQLKINQLIELNSQGQLVKKYKNLGTSDGVASHYLRQSHREGLVRALEKIDLVPLEHRSYSSLTLTMSLDQLPKAKKLIREFRQKFLALMEQNKGEEVYYLGLQLFPLTQMTFDQSSQKNKKTQPSTRLKLNSLKKE